MDFEWTEEQQEIRNQVRALCERFPDEYWRDRDTTGEFPWDFYKAVADGGWLGITIPREYGGAGLGDHGSRTSSCRPWRESRRRHAGVLVDSPRHFRPRAAHQVRHRGGEEEVSAGHPRGEIHVSFAVTEPDAGTNTTDISTFATREGDGYVDHRPEGVHHQGARIARRCSLLTRTTPIEQVEKKTDGMTLFFADIDREAVEVRELHKCGRPAVDTNMLFIDNLYVPRSRTGSARKAVASTTSSTASIPSASSSPPSASAWASARSSAPSATRRSASCFTGRSA